MPRKKKAKSKTSKHKVQKGKTSKGQTPKEKVLDDKILKENPTKEKIAEEKTSKDQIPKEKTSKENKISDKKCKDKVLVDKTSNEEIKKDPKTTDKIPLEKTLEKKTPKETSPKDKKPRRKNKPSDDECLLVNGSKHYYICKKYLCQKIPHFKKILEEQKDKSKNSFEFHFEGPIFEQFMRWVDEDPNFDLNIDNIFGLFNVADYFELDNLKSLCNFDKHVTPYFTAEKYPSLMNQITPILQQQFKKYEGFILRHFLKIAFSGPLVRYSLEIMKHLLSKEIWIESEYQVFQAIVHWIKHDKNSRLKHLNLLLKYVRWRFIDLDEIEKIKTNEIYRESKISLSEFCITDKELKNTKSRIIHSTTLLKSKNVDIEKSAVKFYTYQHGVWKSCYFKLSYDNTKTYDKYFLDFNQCHYLEASLSGILIFRINSNEKSYSILDPACLYERILPDSGKITYSIGSSKTKQWANSRSSKKSAFGYIIEAHGVMVTVYKMDKESNETFCCIPPFIIEPIIPDYAKWLKATIIGDRVYTYDRYNKKLTYFDLKTKEIIDLSTSESYIINRFDPILLFESKSKLCLIDFNDSVFYYYDDYSDSWAFEIHDIGPSIIDAVINLQHPLKISMELVARFE